jgi:hypothetical protein
LGEKHQKGLVRRRGLVRLSPGVHA